MNNRSTVMKRWLSVLLVAVAASLQAATNFYDGFDSFTGSVIPASPANDGKPKIVDGSNNWHSLWWKDNSGGYADDSASAVYYSTTRTNRLRINQVYKTRYAAYNTTIPMDQDGYVLDRLSLTAMNYGADNSAGQGLVWNMWATTNQQMYCYAVVSSNSATGKVRLRVMRAYRLNADVEDCSSILSWTDAPFTWTYDADGVIGSLNVQFLDRNVYNVGFTRWDGETYSTIVTNTDVYRRPYGGYAGILLEKVWANMFVDDFSMSMAVCRKFEDSFDPYYEGTTYSPFVPQKGTDNDPKIVEGTNNNWRLLWWTNGATGYGDSSAVIEYVNRSPIYGYGSVRVNDVYEPRLALYNTTLNLSHQGNLALTVSADIFCGGGSDLTIGSGVAWHLAATTNSETYYYAAIRKNSGSSKMQIGVFKANAMAPAGAPTALLNYTDTPFDWNSVDQYSYEGNLAVKESVPGRFRVTLTYTNGAQSAWNVTDSASPLQNGYTGFFMERKWGAFYFDNFKVYTVREPNGSIFSFR